MTERPPFTGPAGADRDPAVVATDAFLEALSRGEEPSGGADAVAVALAALRDDVMAPGPAVPNLEALLGPEFAETATGPWPGTAAGATSSVRPASDDPTPTCGAFPAVASTSSIASVSDLSSAAPTAQNPSVAPASATPGASIAQLPSHSAPAETPAAAGSAAGGVDDLAARREAKASRRSSGWLGHGLIGAAAATLVIAGGGAMVFNAEPGDALWGVHESLFADHAAVVQLASTLEEADNANAQGDVQGALELLEKARAMAQDMNRQQAKRVPAPPVTTTVTEEVPTTVTAEPGPAGEPETTTVVADPVTETVTVVSTVRPTPKPSAVNLAPGVKPTTSSVPLSAILPPDKPTTAEPTPAADAAARSTTPRPTTVDRRPAGERPSTVAAEE